MSMEFITGSDRVDCGVQSELANIFDGGGTIMAWFWADTYGASGRGRILEHANNNDGDIGWALLMQDGADSIEFWIGWRYWVIVWVQAWGGWRFATDFMDGKLDEWHHVAVAYNADAPGNDAIMYFDGVSQSVTETWTPSGERRDDSSQYLNIGNSDDNNRSFDGWIEDARLYNRILSANEIATIYAQQGTDGIVSGLLGRYMLNEGAKNVVASGSGAAKDNSIVKNDGTPYDSPVWDDYISNRRRRV